jgi:hypothetical protein
MLTHLDLSFNGVSSLPKSLIGLQEVTISLSLSLSLSLSFTLPPQEFYWSPRGDLVLWLGLVLKLEIVLRLRLRDVLPAQEVTEG